MVLKEFQQIEDNWIYYQFTTGTKMNWQRCCEFIQNLHKYLHIEEILSANNSDKEYKKVILKQPGDIYHIEEVDIIQVHGKNKKYNNLETEIILYNNSNVINVFILNSLLEKTGMDENKYAFVLEKWMNKIDGVMF